jgi:ANTAR domain
MDGGIGLELIRVHAPSEAHALRLVQSLDGTFLSEVHPNGAASVVELTLDSDTATQLIDLFNALGGWLHKGDLAACEIGFGERSYTLLTALDGELNDPSRFLLERTLQLQTALDSRIVIERAVGVLVERLAISPDEAFRRLRRAARGKRINLHEHAAEIVRTAGADSARQEGHRKENK